MEKELDFIKLYEEIYKCLPNRNIQMLLDVCYEVVGVRLISYTMFWEMHQRNRPGTGFGMI